jgi:hypothetical protein
MTASETTDFSNRYGEQYQDLRQSFYRLVDASSKLEIYALGAAAALYAWLMRGDIHYPWTAYAIAPVFVVLAGYKAYWQFQRIKLIHNYLYQIEEKFFTGQIRGWQHYVGSRMSVLGRTDLIFWVLLFLFTSLASFSLWWNHPLVPVTSSFG